MARAVSTYRDQVDNLKITMDILFRLLCLAIKLTFSLERVHLFFIIV
jgi:hypothetical protein